MFNLVKRVLGSVVKCLERGNCHRKGRGLKPTRAIFLCPWERHFRSLFLGKLVLKFQKLKKQSRKVSTGEQYLGILESESGDRLITRLRKASDFCSFSARQEDEYGDENKQTIEVRKRCDPEGHNLFTFINNRGPQLINTQIWCSEYSIH